MFTLKYMLCLLLAFCECVFRVKSVPCRGRASYKLQFQAEWKNTSRPAGAGFSGLIGCSHNKCYRMWKPDEKASLGVRDVAEKGDDTELYNVIQKHIETWKTVLERLQIKNNTIGPEAQVLLPETNKHNSGFMVDSSHSLVSIIARILLSPDWFIGVYDVNLCNTSGQWIPEKVITLFPYDAGTRHVSKYNDSNVVPSNPSENIRLLQGEAISDSVRGLGYIRFKRIQTYEQGSAVIHIDEENCPNIASIRMMSSLEWFILIMLLMRA